MPCGKNEIRLYLECEVLFLGRDVSDTFEFSSLIGHRIWRERNGVVLVHTLSIVSRPTLTTPVGTECRRHNCALY